MTLPHLKVAGKYEAFSANTMDRILGECLALSSEQPCCLEVCTDTESYFLFFRDGQVYNAGQMTDGQFSETSIRDFLQKAAYLGRSATCYGLNNKILHSLLIFFQKKASLKLSTSIVDLDQVLDKIEDEGKSCIVSALQDDFLAILRYEKGKVTALCHELSAAAPREAGFREDFLVKIYTLSAEQPLSINVYEDLLVKYAADAKMIDEHSPAQISELYLSKPPVVTLEFKGKEIGQWVLDQPVFNIGRTDDNDIVIDNLAVSRLHAVLEKDKGEYFVRDCDSLNGTLVNDKRIGRTKLEHGDEITIGKHKLRVHRQAGVDIPESPSVAPYDQTIIIGPHDNPAQHSQQSPSVLCSGPRLIERTKSGEIIIEINKPSLILGKDSGADIEVEGMFVAKQHAEIVKENGDYVIRHLNGYRKVSVGGKTVSECVLEDNAEIRIGNSEFIFQK